MVKRICKCCGDSTIQESKFDLIDANVVDNFFNDDFAIVLQVCDSCGYVDYNSVVDYDTELSNWYKNVVNSRLYQLYHKNGLLFDMFSLLYTDSNLSDDISRSEFLLNEFHLSLIYYVRTGVTMDVLPKEIIYHKFLNHFENYLQGSGQDVDAVSLLQTLSERSKNFLALFVGYIDVLRLAGYRNFAMNLCENMLSACRQFASEDDALDDIILMIPNLTIEYSLLLDGYTEICSREYANKIKLRLMSDVTNIMHAIDNLDELLDSDPDDSDEADDVIKELTKENPNLLYQAALANIYNDSVHNIRDGWDPEEMVATMRAEDAEKRKTMENSKSYIDTSDNYLGWTPVILPGADMNGPVNESNAMITGDDEYGSNDAEEPVEPKEPGQSDIDDPDLLEPKDVESDFNQESGYSDYSNYDEEMPDEEMPDEDFDDFPDNEPDESEIPGFDEED